MFLQSQVRNENADVDGVAVEFWMEQLTRIPRWQHERNVLFAVDNLLKAAFANENAEEKVHQLMSQVTLVRSAC